MELAAHIIECTIQLRNYLVQFREENKCSVDLTVDHNVFEEGFNENRTNSDVTGNDSVRQNVGFYNSVRDEMVNGLILRYKLN